MSTMLRESMLRESMLRESMLREPVVDRLTRRRLLGGSVGLLGAGVLAACSGTGPAPATGEVRTVEGAYGPVEVPARAERIVTVSYNTPFQLQAVGREPVGAFDYSALYEQLTADQVAMLELSLIHI